MISNWVLVTSIYILVISISQFYRSTGMGVTLAAGRLGAILGQLVFGSLLDVNCAIPIVAVAVLMITGGLTGLFVPNTTGIALD